MLAYYKLFSWISFGLVRFDRVYGVVRSSLWGGSIEFYLFLPHLTNHI
ncbi:hypothetical protein ACN4EE_11840 [Geminocystis sp. CENA526]